MSRELKGRANSLDIAFRAGVSQATVSRALRGSPLVSRETRLKIEAIARELNYKVDKSASNLRTQKSYTLALLLFEDPTDDNSMINPFFPSMLASITRAAAAAGYDLLVSFQQFSEDWQADYEGTHKADGLILLGYGDYLQSCAQLERLAARGARFVRWGAVRPGQPGVSIGCDNLRGGYEITRHMLAAGRRRIAFLGEADDHYPEFEDRYHGYTEALADAGIEVDPKLVTGAISTERSGFDAAARLLAGGVEFNGLIAASDLIAIGAMQALNEHGLSVPADVAVAGFDDIPMASYTQPPLTTVQQDTRHAGEILVDSLLKLIRNEPVASHAIPVKLVVRQSCGGR